MLERISAYIDRAIGPLNREEEGVGEPPRWQPEQSRAGSDRCESDPSLSPPSRIPAGGAGGLVHRLKSHRAKGDPGKNLAEAAMKFVGRSKADMNGMDCSGFVRMAARLAGTPVERLMAAGRGPNGCSRLLSSMPRVPENEARTGDVVFFKIDKDSAKTASHVGILIVNDDGTRQVLHMTNAGVRLNRFQDKAARNGDETWGDKTVPGGFGRLPG